MLMNEAQWIGAALNRLPTEEMSPLLNVGSATAEFREQIQPWIHDQIFLPLLRRGVSVHHLDIQNGDGIDLQGDLNNDAFVDRLKTGGYQALLCCNVLEHLAERAAICAKLEMLTPVGGYLVVTVPHRFPYHPDPIDTMFRPDPAELTSLFPHCRLVEGAIIDCGTGWDYVDRDPRVLIAKVTRRLSGMKEHGGVKGSTSFFPWLFRRFRQTCVLLQKKSTEQQ